jgi:hypothetical protein
MQQTPIRALLDFEAVPLTCDLTVKLNLAFVHLEPDINPNSA